MSYTSYEFLITCPKCQKHVIVPVDDVNKIKNANHFPVSITHFHEGHALTLFVDQELRVRAVEPSDLIGDINNIRSKRKIKELYIPVPFPKPVKLDGLSNKEIVLVSLSNGDRDITEICTVLGISVRKGKLLAEKLVREKRLLKVEKRIIS